MIRRPALELHNFAVHRGAPLSSPITAKLAPGTILGLIGPNGVGKSSLIAGLAHSGITSSGRVLVESDDVAAMSAKKRASRIALLAQDSSAPAEVRVRDVVRVGAYANPDRKRSPDERADRALAELGIEELAERRFGTLSGGQRQLVQLARVLAQDTPVVVLDEPTSALDLAHQRVVEDTCARLAARGTTIVLAVHDLSLALNLCTLVLLLFPDGSTLIGPPAVVMQPDTMHRAYGVQTAVHTTQAGRRLLAHRDRIHAGPRDSGVMSCGIVRTATGSSGPATATGHGPTTIDDRPLTTEYPQPQPNTTEHPARRSVALPPRK